MPMKKFELQLSKLGINVPKWKSRIRTWRGYNYVKNVNHAKYSKRCLLVYITQPFLTDEKLNAHQNRWQAREIARLIGIRGYVVDVVQFDVKEIKLTHNYDMVVGLILRCIDVYSSHLNPGAVRIAYLTSMNLAVTTANEIKRIEDVKRRRGVELKPRRGSEMVIEKKIEDFDGAWYIGNSYNFHSYDCFKMPPAFRIVNTGYVFEWADSNAIRDPKCFLYFGSFGQVHKGLDLLLELFSQRLTDYTLYIGSSYKREEDFMQAYHKELFETTNIKAIGVVDVNGEIFKDISQKCAYTILPSCAEGCAGSVLTAMSAGLIPIVSKECGFEDDEVIQLPDCSMDTICEFVKEYGKKDNNWISNKSKHTLEVVRNKYSNDSFTKSVENALDGVLKNKK